VPLVVERPVADGSSSDLTDVHFGREADSPLPRRRFSFGLTGVSNEKPSGGTGPSLTARRVSCINPLLCLGLSPEDTSSRLRMGASRSSIPTRGDVFRVSSIFALAASTRAKAGDTPGCFLASLAPLRSSVPALRSRERAVFLGRESSRAASSRWADTPFAALQCGCVGAGDKK